MEDNGNITKTTDAKGVYIEGTYDNFNRIKVRSYSDTTPDVEFYYDGKGLASVPNFSKGKTTKVTSSVSETRYTSFDDLGRLLTHQQITDAQTYGTSYTYNLSGGLISETYPSGRTVNYDINADGDLSRVWGQEASGTATYANSFDYNASGAVTALKLGNGKWGTAKFNNRLQITEIGLGNSASDASLLKLELGYGTSMQNNGSLREQKITVPTSGGNTGFAAIQTYAYDDLNRIQSATETIGGNQTWKQTFTIDRYGNRRFDAANTTTLGGCQQAVCNPTISTSDNRFSSGQGYSYDQNGNVTQDAESRQFLYDAENHQKEVKDAYNVTIGQYLYDGEGKRVKKVSNLETTIFVYDGGGQLVAEYSTQIVETPQVSYLTTDHLGSPRIITDQLGAVASRKDLAAFGDETLTPQRTPGLGYNPPNIRQDYTGYEKDDESGLEFAQARYYNAQHGRFTSTDPLTASASIRNPQTFNRYSYVLNSPYKLTDPLGLLPERPGACGSRCPGSGPTVDGSAFRGRDASFDWAQQFSPPPPLPPNPVKIKEESKKYNVYGATARDALLDANTKAKAGATERGQAGETKLVDNVIEKFGDADLKIEPSRNETTGDVTLSVEVLNVTIEATIVTTLPDWANKDKASSGEQAKWKAYSQQLANFEKEHTLDTTRRLYAYRDAVIGLKVTGSGPNMGAAKTDVAAKLSSSVTAAKNTLFRNYNSDGAAGIATVGIRSR